MTYQERIHGLIGLAKRGKYIAYGEDLLFRINKGQVKLVIFAEDIGDNTSKDLKLAIERKGIASFTMFTKAELGDAIGHGPIAAVGIKNSGIHKRIIELREENEDGKKEQTI